MSYVRWIYVLYLWGNVLTIEKQYSCFLKGSFFHSLPAINNRATKKKNKISSCYFISPLFLKFLSLILVVYLLLVSKKASPRSRLSNLHSKVTQSFQTKTIEKRLFRNVQKSCVTYRRSWTKTANFIWKCKNHIGTAWINLVTLLCL